MIKKSLCLLLMMILILSSLNIYPSQAAEVKINDWPLMKEAIKYEKEKNYSKAIHYYEELVKLYGNYSTEYSYENGGHYAMRAGNYYSGVLDKTIFNPEKATYYYEKAYNFYTKFSELSCDPKYNWAFITAKKKLDEIKTTIDLYIEKDTAGTVNKRPLAKHEPVNGMYIGIYGENNPHLIKNGSMDLSLVKNLYGKDHSSVLYYNEFGATPFPTEVAKRMKKVNGSIQIHMQPVKGLDSVVDNNYIREFAKKAKASDVPIFLRFSCEMYGDWVPCG